MNVVRDAFSKAFKMPLTYAALVGVPLIVCLFGYLYAVTFSDPYERMKDMPVAIVNLDEGTVVNGENKCYGADMLDAILETDSVRWVEEDSSLASEEALARSDYYLAVVITHDFSERIAAGQTTGPEQAQVLFYRNVRKNFMLATFGKNVESALRETVNAQVSSEYARALAQGLADAGDGMQEAVDGASQLADGASQVASGAGDVRNGAEGISSVSDGANALAEGSGAYVSALNDARASFGGDGAASGLASAQAGYQEAFSSFQEALASGNLESIAAAASNVDATAQTLAQASSAYGAVGALDRAISGYGGVGNGIDNLAYSTSLLEGGAMQFDSALATYTTGVIQASSSSSELASGMVSLSDGASSLTYGAATLESGISALFDGTTTLSSGTQTLSESAKTLSDGLSDGSSSINDSITASADEYGDYIASPVDVQSEAIGDLERFGYGFAPLFLTICLWLAALLLFFVFDPFPSYEAMEAGRFQAVLGRWPLYLVMVACVVAALSGVAVAIGLQTTHFAWLVLMFSVVCISFTAILQLFSLFDMAGKALAILALIVQVVCASGTFPAFLGSDFSISVTRFLLFTYAIDAYREVLSGGDFATLTYDLGVIAAFGMAALVLSLLLYPIAKKLKLKRDRETLEQLSVLAA